MADLFEVDVGLLDGATEMIPYVDGNVSHSMQVDHLLCLLPPRGVSFLTGVADRRSDFFTRGKLAKLYFTQLPGLNDMLRHEKNLTISWSCRGIE